MNRFFLFVCLFFISTITLAIAIDWCKKEYKCKSFTSVHSCETIKHIIESLISSVIISLTGESLVFSFCLWESKLAFLPVSVQFIRPQHYFPIQGTPCTLPSLQTMLFEKEKKVMRRERLHSRCGRSQAISVIKALIHLFWSLMQEQPRGPRTLQIPSSKDTGWRDGQMDGKINCRRLFQLSWPSFNTLAMRNSKRECSRKKLRNDATVTFSQCFPNVPNVLAKCFFLYILLSHFWCVALGRIIARGSDTLCAVQQSCKHDG